MATAKNNKLRIILFNVGSGDHILLQFPNGQYGLIDCFYQETFLGQTEPPSLTFLRNISKKKEVSLSFIHISHPDHDHTRGFLELWRKLEGINVLPKHLWLFAGSDIPGHLETILEKIRDHAEENIPNEGLFGTIQSFGIAWELLGKLHNESEIGDLDLSVRETRGITTVDGDLFKDNQVQVHSLAPVDKYIKQFTRSAWNQKINEFLLSKDKDRVDKNVISTALLFVCKNVKLIFGGDVPEDSWNSSFDEYKKKSLEGYIPNFNSHFVKGAHHGSRHSSSLRIWENLIHSEAEKKEVHIAFSAGKKYTHPHPDTLADIDAFQKANDLSISVTSTNMCLHSSVYPGCPHCLVNRGYKVKNMSNLLKRNPSTDDKHFEEKKNRVLLNQGIRRVDETSKADASMSDKLKNRPNYLAALVYEIDIDTSDISLSLWTKDIEEGSCRYPLQRDN